MEFRLKPEDKELLGDRLTALGYTYAGTPSWTAFMEAICRGEIILYKKIGLTTEDKYRRAMDVERQGKRNGQAN